MIDLGAGFVAGGYFCDPGLDDVATGGSLTGIEDAIGGFGGDLMMGSSVASHLEDRFGDDVLEGGTGNDTLGGGIGFDRVDYSSATNGIAGTIRGAAFTGHPVPAADSVISVEDVIGPVSVTACPTHEDSPRRRLGPGAACRAQTSRGAAFTPCLLCEQRR